ncbi:hypothetical protein BT69DRAFT_1276521 [Atractiella rhizophila]|nr:hypothetical protein BT69DRAFT_1276521 [Atractiella rhizophila]
MRVLKGWEGNPHGYMEEKELTVRQAPLQPPPDPQRPSTSPSPSNLNANPDSSSRPTHVKQSSSLNLSLSSFLSQSPVPVSVPTYAFAAHPPTQMRDTFLNYLMSPAPLVPTKPDTVDLSGKRSTHLSEPTIEFIRTHFPKLSRLALGYNYLTNLPGAFLRLGDTLRYLNVRTCMLRKVPRVITQLPKLEILDLRSNKITKMPKNPRMLVHIKVLSLSRNRLTGLPPWFADCYQLRVLKIDNNPLVSPPAQILAPPSSVSNPEDLEEVSKNKGWIDGIRKWIKLNREKVQEEMVTSDEEEDASVYNTPPINMTPPIEQRPSTGNRTPPTPNSRTMQDIKTSPPMNGTGTPPMESKGTPPTPSARALVNVNGSDAKEVRTMHATPPESKITVSAETKLPTSNSSTNLLSDSPSPSPASKATALPNPPINPPRKASLRPSASPPVPTSPKVHGRNASLSSSSSTSSTQNQVKNLKSKKSLPDLRMNHDEIIQERRRAMEGELSFFPKDLMLGRLEEEGRESATSTSMPSTGTKPAPPRTLTLGRSQSDRPTLQTLANGSNVSRNGQKFEPKFKGRIEEEEVSQRGKEGSGSGVDRDSGAYFRRVSMLPPSTISKTVPPALLQFTDAIRGILFSLSQMYSALKQFFAFATDGLPAAVSRVMSTADGSMSRLIMALDRFDTGSRRGTPAEGVIKDVLTTCRENVTIFGSLTGVLAIQLKVLVSTADVRYSRALLLMLHGTMSEVAIAWQTMLPLSKEVMNLLGKTSAANWSTKVMIQPPTPSPSTHGELPFGSGAPPPVPALPTRHTKTNSGSTVFQPSPLGQPAVMPNGSLQTQARESRANSARRHGGSFSVEDVQLGAMLQSSPPSNETIITVTTAPSTSTPPSRMKARPGAPNLTPLPQDKLAFQEVMAALDNQPPTPTVAAPSNSPFVPAQSRHEKNLSRDSIDTPVPVAPAPLVHQSSSASLASLAASSRPGTAMSRSQTPRFNAIPQMDTDFIDQADIATSIAFSTYSMLVECLSEEQIQLYENFAINVGVAKSQSRGSLTEKIRELTSFCETGNEITTLFKDLLNRVRQGEMEVEGGLKKSDISSAFYKFSNNVKRIAELCKMISLELDQSVLPSRVRQGLKALIESTKETAVLLAVSTFNPESTKPTPNSLPRAPAPSSRPGTSNGPAPTIPFPQHHTSSAHDIIPSHQHPEVSAASVIYNFV